MCNMECKPHIVRLVSDNAAVCDRWSSENLVPIRPMEGEQLPDNMVHYYSDLTIFPLLLGACIVKDVPRKCLLLANIITVFAFAIGFRASTQFASY